MVFIKSLLIVGNACIKQATPPAAIGVAIEVPETTVVELLFTVVDALPLALASGFITPEQLGPNDENPEDNPAESTDPMVKTCGLSAGVVM